MNYLRNREGKIIGRFDGAWLRDGAGRLVARYDESDKRTRDATGRIVGDGDQRLRELGRDETRPLLSCSTHSGEFSTAHQRREPAATEQ